MEPAAKAIIAWDERMDILVVLGMMINSMAFFLVNLPKPYKLSFWTMQEGQHVAKESNQWEN